MTILEAFYSVFCKEPMNSSSFDSRRLSAMLVSVMTRLGRIQEIAVGLEAGAKTHSELLLRNCISSTRSPKRKLRVVFERSELDALLFLYGRMVKAGEWRDYALDHLDGRAIFSVFRRSQERPVYCFEKFPQRRQRQGVYAVYDAGGRMLRCSSSLLLLIRYLEERLAKTSPQKTW